MTERNHARLLTGQLRKSYEIKHVTREYVSPPGTFEVLCIHQSQESLDTHIALAAIPKTYAEMWDASLNDD
jgi:hypothetical protein